MELLQRFDQQVVHREPDRTAPVRVAAEQTAGRLGRLVVHAVLGLAEREHVWMLGVVARDRADAVGREELVLVQHEPQDPRQLLAGDDRQQPALVPSGVVSSWTWSRSSGRLSMNHCMRRLKPGSASTTVGLQRLHREQRDEPDQRAHLQRLVVAVGVQDVVVEAIRLVPQADALVAHVVHGVGDVDEVLEELGGDVLVRRVFPGQLQRDGQHVQAVHAHPGGAVGLLDVPAGRQRGRAVEHADVVEAEEAALEDVLALGVLAVDPPREVQQQLVEDALAGSRGRRCRAASARSGRRATRPRRARAG